MNDLVNTKARSEISKLESILRNVPGAQVGDCFPLEHKFADGLYVRQITVPKGRLIVTKIFKKSHATFLLKGEVSIYTEKGFERVSAPASMITQIGTKRVIYTHEDTVWTTVHASKEKDLVALEEEIIAKTYEEADKALLMEAMGCLLLPSQSEQ